MDGLSSGKIESNLIYRLIVDPSLTADILDIVAAKDFHFEKNRDIFAEIVLRYENKLEIDALLIEEATGHQIDVLEMSSGATAPIKEYAETIHDLAVRRGLIAALESAKGRILSGEDPIEVATKAIDAITGAGSAPLLSSGDAVREYRNGYERRSHGSRGISYGISELDDTLLPMRGGRLVIFAARPGIGKTAVAESIGDSVAKHIPVLFVSLEMGSDDLIDRGLARESGRAAAGIIQGEVDVTELEPHLNARSDLNITYLDRGVVGVHDIQRAINQVKLYNEGQCGLVIVDYLQLMDGEPRNDEFQRVSNISHGLKRLAMANDVPVLALAQLNRQLEVDGGRSPRLADLAKSDSIGQDADVVVVINGRVGDPMREFHVIKQRQGNTGHVNVLFDGSTQRWGRLADGEY